MSKMRNTSKYPAHPSPSFFNTGAAAKKQPAKPTVANKRKQKDAAKKKSKTAEEIRADNQLVMEETSNWLHRERTPKKLSEWLGPGFTPEEC